MTFRDWFSPPRHVLAIFLGVALVSAGALIILVRLLLDQERAVETQRKQERLEQAVERGASAMQDAVSDLRQRFERGDADLPEGVVVISVAAGVIVVRPEVKLQYYPEAPAAASTVSPRLAAAERLAFAGPDKARAIALFETLANDPAEEVRAAALNGLAQIHRKTRNFDAALRDYDRIAQLTNARVDGLPSDLLARVGKAGVFEETQQEANLRHEASALYEDLRRGKWRLVRSEFEFYSELARSWIGAGAPALTTADDVARAEGLASLWREKPWQKPGAGEHSALRLMTAGGVPVLSMWSATPNGFRAAVAGPDFLESLCRKVIPDSWLRCALTDMDGRTIVGEAPRARLSASLMPAITGLPWGLQMSISPDALLHDSSSQRGLLLWVAVVLAAVWGIGAWFILRAIARELRVSRLQSEFVAAVSHEFRSPLSSLGQISEMLATDRLESDDLRRKAYAVLNRECERLRDLVESLLDFGRLEAGRALYHFEPLEVGEFLETLIAEFHERVLPAGYRIEWSRPKRELLVRADRAALSRAVTNLLDNAVKYSPECRSVWVEVERKDGRVEIGVRDRGLGIPVREQLEIFERFVRGTNIRGRQIKGTGIGLAMVNHIIRAHGGEVQLSSEPGQGSRFTVVLPES